MIHVKATNMVDYDVFINIFAPIEVDSKVCRIYFHRCRFLESESKVDLKKIYNTSNMIGHWHTIWYCQIPQLYTQILYNFMSTIVVDTLKWFSGVNTISSSHSQHIYIYNTHKYRQGDPPSSLPLYEVHLLKGKQHTLPYIIDNHDQNKENMLIIHTGAQTLTFLFSFSFSFSRMGGFFKIRNEGWPRILSLLCTRLSLTTTNLYTLGFFF